MNDAIARVFYKSLKIHNFHDVYGQYFPIFRKKYILKLFN